MNWNAFAERAREKDLTLSRANLCAKFHLSLPECSLYISDDARIGYELVRLAMRELGYEKHKLLLDLVTRPDWTAKNDPFVNWRTREKKDENVIAFGDWLKSNGYDPEQLSAEPKKESRPTEDNLGLL